MADPTFKYINLVDVKTGRPLLDSKTGRPVSRKMQMSAEEVSAFEAERAAQSAPK